MTIGRIPSVEGGIQPTIVDAKGDLIAGVAADSVNRLAVGSNDQVLVADSSTSTGLAWKSYAAQIVAGKNKVINGGFDIWQRGTSFAGGGAGTGYSADRWIFNRFGYAAGGTISRQSSGLTGFNYAARVQRDSGNTSTANVQLSQVIETQETLPLAGQTVTFSFYARAGSNFSAASNTLKVAIYTGTGTDQNNINGGSFTGSSTILDSSTAITTSWVRYSFNATLASTATEMSFSLYFTPVGTASTNDFFEVTGVQIEAGSVATPFSRAAGTLQGELAACQRYYQNLGNAWLVGIYIGGGVNGNYSTELRFPVQMRGTPTATYEDSQAVASRITTYTGSAAVNNVNASVSLGDKGLTWSISGNNGYIIFNPYNLKVSAEL